MGSYLPQPLAPSPHSPHIPSSAHSSDMERAGPPASLDPSPPEALQACTCMVVQCACTYAGSRIARQTVTPIQALNSTPIWSESQDGHMTDWLRPIHPTSIGNGGLLTFHGCQQSLPFPSSSWSVPVFFSFCLHGSRAPWQHRPPLIHPLPFCCC